MAEKPKSAKKGQQKPSAFTKGKLAFGAVWALLFLLCYAPLRGDGKHFFSAIQWRWEDVLYKLRGMAPAQNPIVLVKFDDETSDKIGIYPWPRRWYAKTIDKLVALGAKTIVFDIIFPEKAPLPEDDRLFVDAIKRSKRTIIGLNLEPGKDQVELKEGQRYLYGNRRFLLERLSSSAVGLGRVEGEDEDTEVLLSDLKALPVVKWPIAPVRNAAAGLGFVNMLWRDSDGQIRVVGTWTQTVDGTIALLSLAGLAHWQTQPIEHYYTAVKDQISINIGGERQVGGDQTHMMTSVVDGQEVKVSVVAQGVEYAFKSLSAIDLFEDRVNDDLKKLVKGGLVFVASTATGGFDHYPSPFSEHTPGVVIHMTAIENLLLKTHFIEIHWLLLSFIIIGMVALPFYLVTLPPLVGAVAALMVLVAHSFLSYLLFVKNTRIEWATPFMAHATTYVVLLVQRTLSEAKEKRWIKNTFGQYLSPKVVEILVNDPTKLTLGGEKRDLTVFFLDIAHFTNISEKMDPEALTQFLNTYLTALTDVIMKSDGVVDKYIGDCIMAFWNAPLDDPKHRLHACLSAVECIETIEKLNNTVLPEGVPERPAVRIGLNSGYAVVGNMGSNMRFSYTVIGDEVNLASRLEGANKFFGSHIMASEATYKGQAEETIAARPLGRVKVVGKEVPILVYELMGEKGKLAPEKEQLLSAYLEGIETYLGRNFEQAVKHFQQCVKLFPGDGPSKLYLRQSQDFALVPPQKEWDGVWSLTTK